MAGRQQAAAPEPNSRHLYASHARAPSEPEIPPRRSLTLDQQVDGQTKVRGARQDGV